MSYQFDILGFPETSLTPASDSDSYNIPNYNLMRVDRTSIGGGVGFYLNKCIKYSQVIFDNPFYTEFEYLYSVWSK